MKFGSIVTQAISFGVYCAPWTSAKSKASLPSPVDIFSDVECPLNCEDLFRKLEYGPDGKKTQSVRLQVRGEPKSGTGMTQEWGWGALAHACLYLKRLYGQESCQILWRNKTEDAHQFRFGTHSIVFEPGLGANDQTKPCNCTGVNKVKIELSAGRKHMLPVDPTCNWFHTLGITTEGFQACKVLFNGPVENYVQLWAYVLESMCKITDDSLQIAVLRDPRAVTVSSYFQLVRLKSPLLAIEHIDSVDAFFIKHLDLIAQWISLRYLLFTQIIPETSEVFWYEDAVADPMEWHGRYYSFVGLRPPSQVIHYAAASAIQGGSILGFHAKGLDYHPGGGVQAPNRTFSDELNSTSLSMMDDVLRKWLPPIILKRFPLVD